MESSRRSRLGCYLIIAAVAMVVAWSVGCSDDSDLGQAGQCPPGIDYDRELERCISDDDPADAGSDASADTATNSEKGTEDADSGGPLDGGHDPCEGITCGANATCDDGLCFCDSGYEGDPDVGCELPACQNVSCGSNATCDDGDCHCDEGYEGNPDEACFPPPPCDGECPHGATCINDECLCDPGFLTVTDGCELQEVSDPAMRTQTEVCQKWNEDPWTMTFDKWADEPQDQCDLGWLSEEYHLEAIRELTRYRWLVGLPAVTASESARQITQACATTLAAEDSGLTHEIPSDYACYTSDAASGAGSSNLAAGSTSAADTVRRYIEDWNTPSLGHRRWVFNPRMAETGFGIRGGYSCQYAFDISGPASPEFTAYPAPGNFPTEALHGKWSLAGSGVSLSSETEVIIERIADGESVSTHNFNYHGASTYRPAMISWNVSGIPDLDEPHRVTVVDALGEGQDLVYELTLISCSN